MRILLIEDDQDIAEIIKDLLTTYSYAVDVEFDGVSGLALAETFPSIPSPNYMGIRE